MKRPILIFSISLAIGILIAYACSSYIYCIFISAVLFGVIVFTYIKKPSMKLILIGISIFYILGIVEYYYIENKNTNKYAGYIGIECQVEGFVSSEPDIRESKINYVIETSEIHIEGKKSNVSGRVLLSMPRNSDINTLDYGREILINGVLNTPMSKRNPGGFDYQRYLAQSRICATIFATSSNISLINNSQQNYIKSRGLYVRNRIIEVLDKSLPEDEAGLLSGMLIGYRGGLNKEVQEAFSDAGLTHLMAVSGMNIAFIILPLVFIFKKIGVNQKYANVIIIFILVFFVFITGFSPSVVRAVIMGIIILVGQLLKREADVINSLAFAAILLLLYNPYTIFDIGFQLSFAATLSLVLFYNIIKEKLNFKYIPGMIIDVFSATVAAQIGVLPITAYYFNKVSIISVISNIIVVPIVEMVSILGFAMAIFGQIFIGFAQIIGYINCGFLSFILFVTKVSASLPFATVRVITPPVVLIIIYYFLVFFFLWYKPKKNINVDSKYYILATSAVFCIVLIIMLMPKDLKVVFIDVGEGDSSFIKTYSGKNVLIDGGGSANSINTGTNIGETTVIPFLMDSGVSKLDVIIATHAHNDHIQGLIPVIENIEVDNLIIPYIKEKKDFKELLEVAKRNKVSVRMCKSNDIINLDKKTVLSVLYPINKQDELSTDANDTSLVVKLLYKNVKILYTGDIGENIENQLKEKKINLNADILKIAHHGSKYSTSEDFLEAVNPKVAVISVGKNNFGHPSEEVLDKLAKSKIGVYRTDRDGAICLSSDGEKIELEKTIKR